MANGIELTASITSVTFLPRDFVYIEGTVWSNYRGGLVVSDEYNKYNKRWFWTDEMPEPVREVLTKMADAATEELVDKKALPTFWPKGLMAEEQHYPFGIHFEGIKVYNPNWDKDKLNEALFRITSQHHFDAGHYHQSVVSFDGGWELNHEVFKVLEEHM